MSGTCIMSNHGDESFNHVNDFNCSASIAGKGSAANALSIAASVFPPDSS